MTSTTQSELTTFLDRWRNSGASEDANRQMFLSELCDVLGVDRPFPATDDDSNDHYRFERRVTFHNPDGTTNKGRIDLYKRESFVLEAKQGADATEAKKNGLTTKKKRKGHGVRGTKGWDDAMVSAYGQAVQYVRALPAEEGNPPFIVVVDIGHTFEIFSDFSRSGKTYIPFPDARNYRIKFDDLQKPEIRERLRLLWEDPMALDPARRAAKVTREVAARLALLARSLEESGHDPADVAAFLMRCLFTMFAEDVKLIPERGFLEILTDLHDRHEEKLFPDMARSLWETMNRGGFHPGIKAKLLRFNGGLFEDPEALPLTREQLELLIDASRSDWQDVEPAIFGVLLERALDPVERHKLGAHYTPRAYVERLVMPTIIEPLREEWEMVRAAAITHAREGRRKEAIAELRAFHRKLCNTRVLDPACGSGNFLYVALEHMKRLEGEVLELLEQLGESVHTIEFTELTVDPHQFLGIELNPRAAAIAEMVLWIGYLQWHFRTHGDTLPREPVLHAYHNIECRDAVLAYDGVEPLLDDDWKPVTRWDGRTMKNHPVTGEMVPDEKARTPVYRYINPRKAEWPDADYVVGNPPFIGNKRMRAALGDGYVEALRSTWKDVSETVDFVMYWWGKAARLLEAGKIERFGFITTNSITQTFNRRVLEAHLDGTGEINLVFAIPDHPWVDSADGAAVRIAMTVVSSRDEARFLAQVVEERVSEKDGDIAVDMSIETRQVPQIHSDLSGDANVAAAATLSANSGLANQGMTPLGEGFRLTRQEVRDLGYDPERLPSAIRRYLIGRDIVQRSEERFIIDLYGLSLEQARETYPQLVQILLQRVKPERDQKKREQYRKKWWIFAEPRATLRPVICSVRQFVVTCRTAKHRVFTRVSTEYLPDAKIVAIGLEDAYFLGVLSSRAHVLWATSTGAWLGVGNDSNYNHADCFNKFPFPTATNPQRDRIRTVAEQLDAHRKRQQELHPGLTITDMYNVLEKLRASEELTTKEKKIHEQGLVSVLKQIHDDLDAAVFDAYGWPATLSDEEILERLVALNAERAAEEANGLVRWLRPEYQNRKGAGEQQRLDTGEAPKKAAAPEKKQRQKKQPWPKPLKDQLQAVRAALAQQAAAVTPDQVAKSFSGAKVDRVSELLESLAALGQAREVEEGRYVG